MKCADCGTANRDEASFCLACGAPAQVTDSADVLPAEADPVDGSEDRRRLVIGLALLAVVIGLLGAVSAVSRGGLPISSQGSAGSLSSIIADSDDIFSTFDQVMDDQYSVMPSLSKREASDKVAECAERMRDVAANTRSITAKTEDPIAGQLLRKRIELYNLCAYCLQNASTGLAKNDPNMVNQAEYALSQNKRDLAALGASLPD